MTLKQVVEALVFTSPKPIALLADASGEDIGKTGKAVIAAGNAYQIGSDQIAKTSTTLLAASTSAAGASIAGYGKFQQYFKVQCRDEKERYRLDRWIVLWRSR